VSRRRWWLLAGAVVLVWLVAAGVLVARATADLHAGRDAATAARQRIDAKAIADGRPLPALRRARAKFGSAAAATGNPVLLPVRALPIVGRQLRSVHAMASAAREVSDAAVVAVGRAHDVLAAPANGGPARVAQVRALRDAVVTADRRVHTVRLGPVVDLVGPLARARDELAAKLADATTALDDASAGAEAGLRLLEGPRHYLVIAANNAEMRAGSGMWLSGGVLTTSGGRLELGPVEPLYQQADPRGAVPAIADADLRDRWGAAWAPNADWRALMVSPRLPASAQLGLAMWKAAGQPAIDGVLVVDPAALAAVVRATGPITAAGRTITADQVVPELLHDQYLQFSTVTAEQADRRQALGAIAAGAFHALDAGSWSAAELATQLGKAVAGRHLLAWSPDPVEEKGWVAAGMAGDLRRDSLLVSVLNRGGNKLDWFTRTEGRIVTTPAGDGEDVSVQLTIRNDAPAGLPRYVAGPPLEGERWPEGTYVGVVAVDVPGGATDVRLVGGTPVVDGRDGAAHVIAAPLRLARGEHGQLTVTFHLAGHHGALAVEPSARVPGMTWHYGARTWQDAQRRMAKW